MLKTWTGSDGVFRIVLIYILNTLFFSIWLAKFLLEIADPRLSDTDGELDDTDDDNDNAAALDKGTSSGV